MRAVRDVYEGPGKQLVERLLERAQHHLHSTWKVYERAIDETPYRAKAFTSGVGLTVADMIAQAVEGSGYDVARTARMASFGLLWHGIASHIWYELLDNRVPGQASSPGTVMAKMVLDQVIWAPFNTMVFYAYLAAATGSLAELPAVLQTKLIPTILAGYALWPLAHIINFRFVPQQHRLLYVNLVNLVWTVWLSGMANNSTTVQTSGHGKPWTRMTPIPVSSSGTSLVPDVVHI